MEKTLVVMAAGIGSRFGGLKQIEPVGPSGEFIIDYSVYDAILAGFKKVVFVIKEELLEDFKKTIGKRIENKIEVQYAFQKIDAIPKKDLALKREKPWGTVQAVLCSKDLVEGDFVVINADDFYGRDSFFKAVKFLDEDQIRNHYASMNMFAFKNGFYQYLEEYFNNFFNQDDDVILKSEALLTDLIKAKIKSNEIVLKNIVSNSKWLGMTYKEDLDDLKSGILNLIEAGEYPKNLWGNYE